MRRVLRENGLTIVLAILFLSALLGQAIAGWQVFNEEQANHASPALTFFAYLLSPHFVEATTENWESEFLQMAIYVVLTAFLFQRGSAESRALDEAASADTEEPARVKPDSPWPVRRGGMALRLYRFSLSIALALIFAISFLLHLMSGARLNNIERLQHGEAPLSTMEYIATAQFWFESLQNWQSEFLAVGSLVVLSIFLRQEGSPQSKPVAASHGQTG